MAISSRHKPPEKGRAKPTGVRIRDLTFRYGDATLFEQIRFDIAPGECVALLGPSGVGKSSLLKIIAGLALPAAGDVTDTEGAPIAGRIAYMAQQDLLLPWLKVLDNVMLGARLRGERPDTARAISLLERVGLADRAQTYPLQLSGGMRQRVAIARTLYEDRPVVLMDEPFSALDAITRTRIQDLAAELLVGRTVLLITHDPMEACRLSHRLLILSGQPARLGAPLYVAGVPPRATTDPEVLRTQAQLLAALLDSAD